MSKINNQMELMKLRGICVQNFVGLLIAKYSLYRTESAIKRCALEERKVDNLLTELEASCVTSPQQPSDDAKVDIVVERALLDQEKVLIGEDREEYAKYLPANTEQLNSSRVEYNNARYDLKRLKRSLK